MPKFVGHSLRSLNAVQVEDNAPELAPARIRLSYSQARLLAACGMRVEASLDTTDRGGIRSYAKRWYRWFAAAGDIAACPRSTDNMLSKVKNSANPHCD
jgi:hypothetical protein